MAFLDKEKLVSILSIAVRRLVLAVFVLAAALLFGTSYSQSQTASIVATAAERPSVRLPDDWDDMTTAEMLKFLADNVTWVTRTDTTKHRDCAGAPHSTECKLEIQAAAGINQINPDSRLPNNGFVVAKIRNIGGRRELRLGIDAGATVYWVVAPQFYIWGKRSHLVSLDGAPRPVRVGKRLRFARCHSNGGEDTSRAAFSCCNGKCPPDSAAHAQAVPPHLMNEHTSPPWITCQNGCCYADQ